MKNIMQDMGEEIDCYLDLKGKNCPMPILETKKALNRMSVGQYLAVEATDPHSEIDFRAYLDRTDHQLLRCCNEEGVYHFLIRK